jgi:hypothetical protein
LIAICTIEPATLKGEMMTSELRARMSRSMLLLILSASICGCSTVKPSSEYIKSLQQEALSGQIQSGALDVGRDCPTCNPDEAVFAQQIVDAEQRFASGCNGIPGAEASYRIIKTMIGPDNSLPGYQTFVANRMCQVAEKYQSCSAPEHRSVSVGENGTPAGALIGAIEECRAQNPSEADEILNRAIAQESESINRAVLAGDYAGAKPELRIYAALPRADRQRAEEWWATIADEESEAKAESRKTAAEVKNMVCDDTYFARNPETGYGSTVGGLNMRHGGHIGSDNPFDPLAKTDTKESRMATLMWELSNADEVSIADAQKMLQHAYAHAAKDPSYCGAAN